MTDMSTTTAAPAAAAPKAKVRQKAITRFPYQHHAGVTPAMDRSIQRLSAGNSLLATADIIRMALHGYLLQNDPMYQREFTGNRNA